MTTSPFPDLTAAEQVFYDVVWQPIITGAETALAAFMPMPFGLPVLHQIDDAILDELSKELYALICQAVDIEAIQLVNADAQNVWAGKQLQLKIIIQESGVNSPEYQKGVSDALSALAQFVSFHG